MARLKQWWIEVKLPVAVGLLAIVAGFVGAQWQQRADARERSLLLKRFPIVREQERKACEREFSAKVDGLEKLSDQGAHALADVHQLVQDTHALAEYILRFLGDRAKVNDARQAVLIKQAKQATTAATTAAQKSAVVEQNVAIAAAKAVEAASTAKAVDRKLDTAVRPALPAQPWAGDRR